MNVFLYVDAVIGVDMDVNIHKSYVSRSILRSENTSGCNSLLDSNDSNQ